jgi:hypothetical protein
MQLVWRQRFREGHDGMVDACAVVGDGTRQCTRCGGRLDWEVVPLLGTAQSRCRSCWHVTPVARTHEAPELPRHTFKQALVFACVCEFCKRRFSSCRQARYCSDVCRRDRNNVTRRKRPVVGHAPLRGRPPKMPLQFPDIHIGPLDL